MQREITVIANSQNKNEVYMSNADTFGELKAELINKGYEVEDMDFKEGKSRTELKDEISPLPSHFNYKGVETSDLVIMITPRNTKIKSGAMSGKRADLYSDIKHYGLELDCYEVWGKNYTQCSNEQLEEVINDYKEDMGITNTPGIPTITLPTPGVTKSEVREIVNEELDKREGDYSLNSLALCVLKVINFLEGLKIGDLHIISKQTCDNWRKSIRKDYKPYTQEELDEMFN